MKKKRFSFLVVLCLMIACITFLVACNDAGQGDGNEGEHKHTYAEKWSSDDVYHWHAATCEHADEVNDKAEHVWSEAVVGKMANIKEEGEYVQTCEVCGAVKKTPIPKSVFDVASAVVMLGGNGGDLEVMDYSPLNGKIYARFTTIAPSACYVDAKEQQGLTEPITANTPKLIERIEVYDAYLYEQYGEVREVEMVCGAYNNEVEGEYYYYWMSDGLMDALTEYIMIITLDKEYDTFRFNFGGIEKYENNVSFAEENYYVFEQGKQVSFLIYADNLEGLTYYYKSVNEPFESFTTVAPTAIGEYEVRAFVEEDEYFRSGVANHMFSIVSRCNHEWGDNGLCPKCGNYGGKTVGDLYEKANLQIPMVSEITGEQHGYMRIWIKHPGEYFLRATTNDYVAKVYTRTDELIVEEKSRTLADPIIVEKASWLYFAIVNKSDTDEDCDFFVSCGHAEFDEVHVCTSCGQYVGETIESLNEEVNALIGKNYTGYYIVELGARDYVLEEITESSTSLYEYKIYNASDNSLVGINEGSASKFVFTAPDDGDYYIHIKNVGADGFDPLITGINFKIYCKDHDILEAGFCGNCSYYCGESIAASTDVTMNIAIGEKAYYKYEVTGNSISVTINGQPMVDSGYHIYVYNVFSILYTETTSTYYILAPDTTPGTYYIVVENVSDASESATINVNG